MKAGKNSITEIPKERWDFQPYYDSEPNAYQFHSKWGGFIEDIDKFDATLFNISPSEAKAIDPQGRLLLETVWSVFEDAGYTRKRLTELQEKHNLGVGVFMGSMYQHYPFLVDDPALSATLASTSYWFIANRLSYFFNLQGPSFALDSACASALTAVHLACESIRRGESVMAIAGGVNLNLHPAKYQLLNTSGMLCSEDKSKSMGEGDGFVPSEGVGAILLKPLSLAIQDNDPVYAVIKSSFINHGGTTQSFTVPNHQTQTSMIIKALERAHIDPRTINYIEVAANGSSLGDAIEIAGLTAAFNHFTDEKAYCALGSVKSNIGHLEAASGISQLSKVICQLSHQKLVPTLNADPLNPSIDLDDSPFYLQKELSEWEPVTLEENGVQKTYPRRAAITSIGAGGANAHIIIEEFKPSNIETENKKEINRVSSTFAKKGHLIVLSAKSEKQLKEYAKRLLEYLDDAIFDLNVQPYSLSDIAYTLQVGREAMEERLVLIVSDKQMLMEQLDLYLNHKPDPKFVICGHLKSADNRTEMEGLFLKDKDWKEVVKETLFRWSKQGRLKEIAKAWVSGTTVDWLSLYEPNEARFIHLPSYPFERKQCWITTDKNSISNFSTNHVGQKELIESEAFLSRGNLSKDQLETYLCKTIAALLEVEPSNISLEEDLSKHGLDSIMAIRVKYVLENAFAIKIPMGNLW